MELTLVAPTSENGADWTILPLLILGVWRQRSDAMAEWSGVLNAGPDHGAGVPQWGCRRPIIHLPTVGHLRVDVCSQSPGQLPQPDQTVWLKAEVKRNKGVSILRILDLQTCFWICCNNNNSVHDRDFCITFSASRIEVQWLCLSGGSVPWCHTRKGAKTLWFSPWFMTWEGEKKKAGEESEGE